MVSCATGSIACWSEGTERMYALPVPDKLPEKHSMLLVQGSQLPINDLSGVGCLFTLG